MLCQLLLCSYSSRFKCRVIQLHLVSRATHILSAVTCCTLVSQPLFSLLIETCLHGY